MRQLNLSTRNSKNLSHKDIRKSILTGLWIVFFLMVIDFTVNFLFAYPAASLLTNPSQLQLYFNYGHSIEGKVAQMVAPTDESSSAIAQAGWLDPNLWQKLNLPTSRASNEDLLVAIYGMSFSNHVGEAMKEIDPKIGLRLIAAPAGPPNYAYAAYKLDRGRHKADVAILGILASSVKGLSTLNGMTWQFEGPAPYTYPQYFLENGKLKEIPPLFTTLAQFRTAFANPQQWSSFVSQLRQHDQFFDGFVFERKFDNSAIVRLIRRAWAQRHQKAIEDQIHDATGFKPPSVSVLKAIVTDFAATAKNDGILPIVLLLNDRSYDDHLFRALESTLNSAAIPTVSSHNIAPASNLKNFISDGHFVKSADLDIAKVVLKLIHDNLQSHPV